MTSDSLRRNPLSQKQYQINGDSGVVCRGLKYEDTHYSNVETSLRKECSPTSIEVQKDHCTSSSTCSPPLPTSIVTCAMQSTSPSRSIFLPANHNSSNMYGGGFRYHIRRPVESWKFFETNKSDGSKVYLCRLCGSSYKHKKSLNKHWKDKHFTELSNAEENDQADGEFDEGDDGDGDDSEGDGKPPNKSYNTPFSSIENISLSKLNNSYLERRETYSCKSLSSVGRIYNTAIENSENYPPSASQLLLHRTESERNGIDVKSENIVNGGNMTTEGCRSGRLSIPGDYSNRSFAGRRRLSTVPFSSPVVQPKLHSRVSEYGVKRVRSPNTDSINVSSKRRHSVLSRERNDRTIDINEKCYESSCYSNMNTPNSETTSICVTSRLDVNSMEKHVDEMFSDEVKPLDLSVVKSIETEVEYGRPLSGASLSPGSTVDAVATGACTMNGSMTSRQEEVVSVTSTASSRENNKNKKKETHISRSLLIGLLQTALNTLENEVDDKISGSCESSFELSTTSASLLVAVGSLLITLSEKRSGMCSTAAPLETCVSKKSSDEVTGGKSHSCCDGAGVLITGSEKLPDNSGTCLPVSPNEIFSCHVDLSDSCTSRSLEARKFSGKEDDKCIDSEVDSRKDKDSFSTYECGTHEHEIPFEAMDNTPSLTAVEGMKKCDGSEPVIICPVCKFGARWFSELRAHMVNHSEHRMFGCCYCHYRAKWKWDVAKHMRRCPLGRHVSHLQNEALLRIVRYYPPPDDDILYSYFPQNGFPGVGVDHPPTPPMNSVKRNGYERVRAYDCEGKDYSLFSSRLYDEIEGCVVKESEKKIENGTNVASTSVSGSHSAPQCYSLESVVDNIGDSEPDESGGLVIVDEDGQDVEKNLKVSCGARSVDGSDCVFPTGDQSGQFKDDEDINKSDLICRVRKCPLCEFHSTDKIEFQIHWNSHCPYTNETVNSTGR
ncbi:zinc finger Xfin-like [Schistosoma japonicum]|uniref:Zinc finger Xfin-like n=1 Tax=Schistosoma japonicum TaxID=6182 RepID=A0A4Z2DVJ6_SCHJA|nr:Zinc finger C2H2 [Schistosoma japonicum]TNN20220.1 zinc finger Xfin-like [Schistosoma japonicum]